MGQSRTSLPRGQGSEGTIDSIFYRERWSNLIVRVPSRVSWLKMDSFFSDNFFFLELCRKKVLATVRRCETFYAALLFVCICIQMNFSPCMQSCTRPSSVWMHDVFVSRISASRIDHSSLVFLHEITIKNQTVFMFSLILWKSLLGSFDFSASRPDFQDLSILEPHKHYYRVGNHLAMRHCGSRKFYPAGARTHKPQPPRLVQWTPRLCWTYPSFEV